MTHRPRTQLLAACVAATLLPYPALAEREHHHRSHRSKKKAEPAAETATPDPNATATPSPASAPTAAPEPTPTAAPPATASPSPSSAARKASAQVDLNAGANRPWARGITEEEQRAAELVFREGNGLLKESLFVQAAEKYRESLRHWDHPATHYNLSLALLNLDQPVEVFLHLEQAMKYGPAPLELDKFEHAGRYRALIEKQLARVEVRCDKPGAVVTMDGQPLFTGPGRHEALLRAGQHTFVATKPGFITTQKAPSLPAGQKTRVDLEVFTSDEMIQYKRRWTNALPWSVLGAGLVLAGVGGVMHWQASTRYGGYDQDITACAASTGTFGCMPTDAISGRKTAGDGLQAGAFVAYGLGGAAVISGLVLAVLNRARPVRVERDSKVSASAGLVPGAGGASAVVHF